MKTYTVKQLARLARISVRTLHHYDQIGLLRPSQRSPAGYRLYGQMELLRLQQVLFYKTLDFRLEQIKEILDQPGFDQIQALRGHRLSIQKRIQQSEILLETIDKTIAKLSEANMELTDEELYQGLTPEQAERYPRQARERYDPKLVEESERRIRRLSKDAWQAIKLEGDEITRALAGLMGRDPGDPEVQAWVVKHHAWIEHFFSAPTELYRGLGQGYAADPEFRATYDRYQVGLADFLNAAIDYYCTHDT